MILRPITSNLSPEIPEATKRITPTGGVIMPSIRAAMTTIPKWMGWMPNAVPSDTNMGANMTMFGGELIKHPAINSMITIRIKGISGFEVTDFKEPINKLGILLVVIICRKV
jgi:hypothetical protein